ncbi:MAG: alpha/beta hydrolase [Nocardioides sp.]|uniref:alpha/beta fold hydrolase n=1 Tax=Nocardioides sp. TaxID=35761 RepID=UPI0039E679E1
MRVVTIGRRELFVTGAGTGDPVVLVRGGGPGATGASNYVRKIDALVQHFRALVPICRDTGRRRRNSTSPIRSVTSPPTIRMMLDEVGIEKAHLVATRTAAPPPRCAWHSTGRTRSTGSS